MDLFSDIELNITDTIAAICTGPGGALAIIRISGPKALAILQTVWHGKKTFPADPPRMFRFGHILEDDGETCLAVYMPAPHSYTGEDVAEIHVHGGDYAPRRTLKAVLDAGARIADPGEFTKRAFINGKLDLTQAEAVMELISAQTDSAGKLAEKQMAGLLGKRIRNIRLSLIDVLSEMESRLDFPDEDLDFVVPEKLLEKLSAAENNIKKLLDTGRSGKILREGIRIALAGAPNCGKSSLMNAMLGIDRAIVTAIPGTTRDTLEESLSIRGILCRITDTAGLRENSPDPVEKIGIERSKETISQAELVIWMLDASRPDASQHDMAQAMQIIPSHIPAIVCWNKTDLLSPEMLASLPALPQQFHPVRISAVTGDGLESLADTIENLVWKKTDSTENDCAIAERHEVLLQNASEQISQAGIEIQRQAWELGASCLHQALFNLGTITGEDVQPDLLDHIFSKFCIGK